MLFDTVLGPENWLSCSCQYSYFWYRHFLHLHHWYYAWILGMHANLNVWWSRLTMAFFWGIYINGIAIFGRDPIMTCAITLYQSQNQLCPYTPSSEEYTLETLFGAIASDPQDCGTALEDAS